MMLRGAITCALFVGASFVAAQPFVWHDVGGGEDIAFAKRDGFWTLIEAVSAIEEREMRDVVVAMNGGMFHASSTPVGLFIESGNEQVPLNTESGLRGNFFLLPNGVFGRDEGGRYRVETTAAAAAVSWRDATQSGPMLLIGGAVHPAFNPDSENRRIRNGAGIRPDGSVALGISTEPVTLYEMAMAFRERGCTDALYLDGGISQIYKEGRLLPEDAPGEFAVVIAVLAPAR
jgi:uncharacterized protein YigE (DUF2233 family)